MHEIQLKLSLFSIFLNIDIFPTLMLSDTLVFSDKNQYKNTDNLVTY